MNKLCWYSSKKSTITNIPLVAYIYYWSTSYEHFGLSFKSVADNWCNNSAMVSADSVEAGSMSLSVMQHSNAPNVSHDFESNRWINGDKNIVHKAFSFSGEDDGITYEKKIVQDYKPVITKR